ncbi:MAG: tRNA (N6-threonylcarbamoyladenosine(37)-N6)-methyltransferase TrmO [Eubacterium sp.]|nr:tRNA (N6-threonylcarbamoyladenosine(37)-N6)-methyltransferase TrmO [Eubacterium sp.]
MQLDSIAHIQNDYKEKFGIPRQSGLVNEVVSRIIFDEKYRNPDAVRGLEEFSHLWLIWVFSEQFASRISSDKTKNDTGSTVDFDAKTDCSVWSPTVRPPRLGGNERIGVFATRSPNRPNPIGLSLVELVAVEPDTTEGPILKVKGADLMDGTPILDIKPYIVYADSRPDAVSGFASEAPDMNRLTVTGLENLPADIDHDAVVAILSADPRPAYQHQQNTNRTYGMKFGAYDIRFRVSDNTLHIINEE